MIVLRKPISYEKLRAEIASAFGAVDITYHHDQVCLVVVILGAMVL